MSVVGPYLLGHSAQEAHRLTVQARILAPITSRFFQAAGIVPGMRVLDVGSGMGDVAFLAADLVGPHGSVVGADLAPSSVEAATARARQASRANVQFVVGDPSQLDFDQPFDAVVGRYVLMYQTNPGAMLKALTARLRPGGVMVFHELDWGGARSVPAAPTFDQCCRWVVDTLQHGGAEAYMGTKLHAAFAQAGLPAPTMRLEAICGGPGDPSGAVQGLIDTVFFAAMTPTLEQHGIARASEIGADSIAERMMSEIAARGSVIVGRSEIGAWAQNELAH